MTKNEVMQEAAKAAPPVPIAAATIAGYTLQDWVVILTALYLLMQMGWFVYSKWKAVQNGSIGE